MAERSIESIREELGKLLPIAAVGVVLGVTAAWTILPHPVEPLDVPLPSIEWQALAPIAAADAQARERVEKTKLPAEIRAIASAYYAWNDAAAAAPAVGEANVPENPHREHLRGEIRASIAVARQALGAEKTFADLRTLRAYDAELFLDELEHPGRDPKHAELNRLSGALTDVLARNGWIGPSLEPHVPRAILRIRYKLHWTSIVFGLADCDRDRVEVCYGLTTLPLEPIEIRTLLAYLVAHPVVRPEDLERRGNLEAATDARRLVYVDRLAELDRWADPSGQKRPFLGDYDYPLARGVMLFRAGFYPEAEQTLRMVAEARRNDGRAQNWYLAAVAKNHPTD